MSNINLNLDSKTLEQCLKEVSDFGGTTYQNICNGASNYVAWGGMDWFITFILCVLGLALAVLFISMAFKVIQD